MRYFLYKLISLHLRYYDLFTGLRVMQSVVRKCDCVLEVHDARVSFTLRSLVLTIYWDMPLVRVGFFPPSVLDRV